MQDGKQFLDRFYDRVNAKDLESKLIASISNAIEVEDDAFIGRISNYKIIDERNQKVDVTFCLQGISYSLLSIEPKMLKEAVYSHFSSEAKDDDFLVHIDLFECEPSGGNRYTYTVKFVVTNKLEPASSTSMGW